MLFLDDIKSGLLSSSLIAGKVPGGRIRYYSYEDGIAATEQGPIIILDPLGPDMPAEYADDTYLMYDGLIQVDVWSRSAADTTAITAEAMQVLFKKGYVAYGGAYNEFDRGTGIYRQAVRVRAKKYIN